MIDRLFVDYHIMSLPTPVLRSLPVTIPVNILNSFSNCVLTYNKKRDFLSPTEKAEDINDGIYRVGTLVFNHDQYPIIYRHNSELHFLKIFFIMYLMILALGSNRSYLQVFA